MTKGIYDPETAPDDMSQLKTNARDNLVDAVNEVFTDLAVLLAAEEVLIVPVIFSNATVALPALPAGSIITGAQLNVTTPFTAGTTIEIGDHSGGSGALAASALTAALGTATSDGNYSAPFFYTPVGALQVGILDAPAAGVGTVLIRYVNPTNKG